MYDIFDYLEGCDIFKSFDKLNLRFQQLILSPNLPLKISLNAQSDEHFQHQCRTIIQPNQTKIRSFRLIYCQYSYEIFNQFLSCSILTCLQSVSLVHITPIQLLICFPSIELLTQLVSLKIQFIDDEDDYDYGYDDDDDDQYYINSFVKLFSLSSVKYLHISMEKSLNGILPLPSANQHSFIETLVLSGDFYRTQTIISILHYTPLLQCLSCKHLCDYGLRNNDSTAALSLPNLTSLIVHNCHVCELNVFERFIQKFSQQIQKLRIDNYRTSNFIYPNQWEQLITRCLPKLIFFKLKYEIFLYPTLNLNHFPTFNHVSTSTFYSSHQWILQLTIDPKRITYTISSNSAISLIKPSLSSMDLLINYSFTKVSQQSFFNILRRVLNSIEFLSLNLTWNCLYGDYFIQLMNLLPKLQVLYLIRSIYFPQGCVSLSDADTFRSMNKLTRISLSMPSFDSEYLRYLTIFFPYLKYLKLFEIKPTDLISIVVYILQRIPSRLKYLQSIRLQVVNINNQIVRQLNEIIIKQKLLRKYTIRQINDFIYIQRYV